MKKEWRVVKVEYIQSNMTLSEAMVLKRRLNDEREGMGTWAWYYKVERMEAGAT